MGVLENVICENSLDLNLNKCQTQHMCRPNERLHSAVTVNRAIIASPWGKYSPWPRVLRAKKVVELR